MKDPHTIMDLLSALTEGMSTQDILSADLISELSCAIAKQRLSMGLSQGELAARLGKAQSTISKWENGDMNFNIETLAEIAVALGMELTVELKPEPVVQKQADYRVVHSSKVIHFPRVKQLHRAEKPFEPAALMEM